jgi:hypothetical protein
LDSSKNKNKKNKKTKTKKTKKTKQNKKQKTKTKTKKTTDSWTPNKTFLFIAINLLQREDSEGGGESTRRYIQSTDKK